MAVEYKGHTIDVGLDRIMGGQLAFYDGQRMCRKWGTISDTTLEFKATEDGEEVGYEVDTSKELFGRPQIKEVRRNGETVYAS